MNNKIKVSIIVKGGNIQEIRADSENLDVIIIDYDNLEFEEAFKEEYAEQQEEHDKLPFGGF